MAKVIIHLESIQKSYFMGKHELQVLKGECLYQTDSLRHVPGAGIGFSYPVTQRCHLRHAAAHVGYGDGAHQLAGLVGENQEWI